jgi:hypothetical protein
MATVGNFKLVQEDERNDTFLTASKLLQQRLAAIQAANIANNKANGTNKPTVPTFADIEKTHANYLTAHYRPYVALASNYTSVKASGGISSITSSTSNVLTFTFPIYGTFTSDMVLHIQLGALGSLTAGSSDPLYRWCAKPGIRLIQRVQFVSDSKVIDEYTADNMLFTDKFDIPKDRRTAWDLGMGQSVTQEVECFNANGHTSVLKYKDGLQTLKQYHPPTDLWIPLDFSFCKDVGDVLFNDLIPNTERKILVTIAPLNMMVGAFNNVTSADSSTVPSAITLPITQVDFSAELYVNNLYVENYIADIYEAHTDFTLFRCHKLQIKSLDKSSDSVLLNQLKFPVEHMRIGFRSTDNKNDLDLWCMFGKAKSYTSANAIRVPIITYNTDPAILAAQILHRQGKNVDNLDTVVDRFNIIAQTLTLFPDAPSTFYSQYLPQRYFDKTSLVSSKDKSAYNVPFDIYPGQTNPNGYFNLSTAREFYLTYVNATSITPTTPVEVVVDAKCLNFIVRKGDSFTLKYTL